MEFSPIESDDVKGLVLVSPASKMITSARSGALYRLAWSEMTEVVPTPLKAKMIAASCHFSRWPGVRTG